MSIVLFHHPLSRAATVVEMLEEVAVPYKLEFVDLQAGAQRSDEHLARNRMGKVPVLRDGDTLVAEASAIGVYLADRYAPGHLAPALDDDARGPYLRWCFFAPSVLEPAAMAQAAGWDYATASAGFGDFVDVLATLEQALDGGPFLLGERFTMADTIVGSTLRSLLRFGVIEGRDALGAYLDRLSQRPAVARADEKNAAIAEEHGLLPSP